MKNTKNTEEMIKFKQTPIENIFIRKSILSITKKQ